MESIEKFFKLKENGTNVSTEIYAGITTFMTMAYILIVNPNILSAAGMDWGGLFTATALASFLGTMAMSLMANYPFALAPGMGVNAYFAFTVAAAYGWQVALMAVFAEGVLFILLSIINVREAIFDAIPTNLKYAVSVGIGLFITFIGLVNAGIVIGDPSTNVALGNMHSITTILALIGIIITMFFLMKKIKGALLCGIICTYVLGIICQFIGLYQINPDIGQYSLIPAQLISPPPSLAPNSILTAVGALQHIGIIDFLVVMFAFLFVDVFDTIGTLIGVSSKAGFLDERGKLPRLKQALLADAIGTVAGAAMGTSTVTTYVESASGVADGGRTGLTSAVTALLFLVALLFSPIFGAIPSFATAPALIVVGLFMVESVVKIDFSDFSEGLPAFLAIIMMPLAYSIADGMIFGVLSYVILKLISGRAKEVSVVMYVIAVLFAFKLFM